MKPKDERADREWLERRFPQKAAREAADAAVDTLGADEPMSAYIDVWLSAYAKAAGCKR
jgi:hypothetical protein